MDHPAPEEIADGELVERYTSTNDSAYFDALVRRHIAQVRSMVVSIVINDADADDVTQDVFMRALRGLPNFKQKARFSTWLHTITMNTTRTFLKKRGVVRAHSGETLSEDLDMVTDSAEPHAGSEMDAEIEKALTLLPPRLRTAITLTAIQQLSGKEAARIEGCAVSTIHWRVSRARRIISRSLARSGVEET